MNNHSERMVEEKSPIIEIQIIALRTNTWKFRIHPRRRLSAFGDFIIKANVLLLAGFGAKRKAILGGYFRSILR